MKRSYMIRKAGVTFGLRAIVMALKILILPVIIGTVGKQGYGIYVLILSLTTQLNLFESGLGRFLVFRMSEWGDRVSEEEAGRVYSTAAFTILVLGLASSAIFAIILFTFFDPLFKIPPEIAPGIVPAKICAVIMFLAIFGTMFCNRALAGLHAFELTNSISIAMQIVVFVGVVLVVRSGAPVAENVNRLSAVYMANAILTFAVSWWVWARRHPGRIGVSPRRIDFGLMREGLTFAWPFAATEGLDMLTNKADTWIVGAMLGPGAAAVLDVAKRILWMVKELASELVTTVFPFASRLLVTRKEAFGELYREATYYVFALTGALAVGAAATVAPVVSIVFGEEFHAVAPLVWVLMMTVAIASAAESGNALLMSMDKYRYLLKYRVAAAGLAIGLQGYLVHRVGITGAAWGAGAATLLLTIAMLREQSRWIPGTVAGGLKRLGRPAIFLLTVVAIGFWVLPLQHAGEAESKRQGLALLAVWGGALGVLLVAGSYGFVLRSREKHLVAEFVVSRMGRWRRTEKP